MGQSRRWRQARFTAELRQQFEAIGRCCSATLTQYCSATLARLPCPSSHRVFYRHRTRRWATALLLGLMLALGLTYSATGTPPANLPPSPALHTASIHPATVQPESLSTEQFSGFLAQPPSTFPLRSSFFVLRSSQALPPDDPQSARLLYEAGRYREAIAQLETQLIDYRQTGDRLHEGLTLANLSLAHQQLGEWAAAERHMTEAVQLLNSLPPRTQPVQRAQAQALTILGRLQFARGQADAALESWERATALFQQVGDLAAIDTQMNQAQALRSLGLYRRAIAQLAAIDQQLAATPDSLTKVQVLRTLGDAQRVAGDLDAARQALEQSRRIAAALHAQSPTPATQEAIAAVTLSLANLGRARAIAALGQAGMTPTEAVQRLKTPLSDNRARRAYEQRQQRIAATFLQQTETVLRLYTEAAQVSPSAELRLQAALNQLSLLVETAQWEQARSRYSAIQQQLDLLPPSRPTLFSQIELAQLLTTLSQASGGEPDLEAIARRLSKTVQQAREVGDLRAESFALGSLGHLYEQTGQWREAQTLTQQALNLAQQIAAADIAYRWQWQLGRLLLVQGDKTGAIAAYSQSVQSLQAIRGDLVAINRDVQFSFRESVEPVYRQLVDLLLDPQNPTPDLERLVQARDVIEGLQVAELDNFFREACLDTQFQLDRVVDLSTLPAAVLYTIVLPDRIEVILKQPQQPLRRYATPVSQETVERVSEDLLRELRDRAYPSPEGLALSQQVYDWLIRPIADQLTENQTLVFVLDGALRNVPMAALHDGRQYLIEHYSVALAPGLQLPDPRPLQQRQFRALMAGLTEARDNFPALPNVEKELAEIQKTLPSRVLLNTSFTQQNFQNSLSAAPASIVHVATHGEFSSNAADTFILAWDSRVNVKDLSSLLQVQELDSPEPIELLVLSACRTAEGDRRATLGLAGVAVRAGARSTIASLWSVDDEAGADLMIEFYHQLTRSPISKAEALRQAQLSLLRANYDAPRFWASYVLLGNWL
ncbi:CHAT domain-containing protein [Thermoleptolyngbya sp. C42_A2020_037]|uniref:CHAT domain-containing protein n=1 Tax=Thermoleptolyngbya sp. C42_A2020_037 TaxID=2747799 RepID=UPI0025CF1BFD|nr:CHAT domain-containing protein [Thermoleptolyngbya sp. C42_A2020_037]